jgi:hypothetical protein
MAIYSEDEDPNVTQWEKENVIQAIRKIIERHGGFSIADVEGESSPLINSMGKDNVQLAERFYLNSVDAITYVHETEVSDDSIPYRDLDVDVLEEILTLAQNYEADSLQTEKRIQD